MGFLLSHSPGNSGNGKGKALFGDEVLNLEKGALQSGQTSWYNQWWKQIDTENEGLAHSRTDLWMMATRQHAECQSSEALEDTCSSGFQTYFYSF